MIDELYIDGQRADLAENSGITLNFRTGIFSDVGKIFGNYTNTIRLPRTANNLRILETINTSTKTEQPYKYHDCDMYRDGIPIIKGGRLAVLGTGDNIEATIIWGVNISLGGISDSGSVKNLKNSQTWRVQNNFNGYHNGDYFESERLPCVQDIDMINHIFSDYGVTAIIDNATDYSSEKWYIPLISAKDIEATARAGTFSVEVSGYLDRISEDEDWFYPLKFKDENRPNTSYIQMYAADTSEFVMKKDTEKVHLSGNITVILHYIDNDIHTYEEALNDFIGTELIVGYKYDGEIKTALSIKPTELKMRGSTTIRFAELVFSFLEEESEIVGTYAVVSGVSVERFQIMVHGSGNVKVTNVTSGVFTMWAEEYPVRTKGSSGKTLNLYVVPNLPDINQIDFLKAICAMRGMFMYVKGKEVHFKSYKDFLNEKKYATDWSDIVVDYGEVEYTLDGVGQRNLCKYKEYKDANIVNDSSYTVPNETLPAEETYIDLPFSNVGTKGDGYAYIPIYSYQKDQDLVYGHFKPNNLTNAFILRDTITSDTWSLKPISWEYLLEKFHKERIAVLQDISVVTVRVRLSTSAIYNLELHKPVYLKQHGAYFGIMELKTKKNDICEAKLIKI